VNQNQTDLLLALKASKDRGSASMSCGQRRHIAYELVEMKMIELHSVIAGSYFYRINEKGLKALKGKYRNDK